MKLENGATYFGEWINDLRHGKGILICDVFKFIHLLRMDQNMKGTFIKETLMVEGDSYTQMAKFMKDSGRTMKHMVKGLTFMKMVQHTQVCGNMIYNMGRGARNGLMEGKNAIILKFL